MHLYRLNQNISRHSRHINTLFGVRASRHVLFEPFRINFSTAPSSLNTDEERKLDHLSKRKIALVAGYLGSEYHGVQLNDGVPTIENEIRKSLLAAGCIRESNYEDLDKIGWSRSSRTDKGVHAGCIVFAGKLLIDETKVHKKTGRVLGLTEALNEHLPETIRVFSATKVNKKFSARKACVLREYEYFMPLSFLIESRLIPKKGVNHDDDFDIEEAIEKFHTTLGKYAGIHDFHNFTKSRSYFYRIHHEKMQYKKQQKQLKKEDNNGLDGIATEEDQQQQEEEEGQQRHDEYSMEENEPYKQDPTEQTRDLLPRHRRAVYACSGSVVENFYGEKFLRVHIVGQAFLLNQIRCMVGGALAVATSLMSEELFDAALKTNHIIRVPIAPAEGLVLLSSTFGGKLHSVSLYEDPNTKLATLRKDVEHRMLLNLKEDEAMARFRQDMIYPQVVQAWKSETKMDRWKAYLERVYEQHHTQLNMKEIKQAFAQVQAEEHNEKQKQYAKIQQRRHQDMMPKSLVPKQFTTKICVRYSVAPGIFTADLRRGVAKHLKDGKIPMEITEEEIFQYIDDYGVKKIAEEGKLIRLMMEIKKPLPLSSHLAPKKKKKTQRPRPGWNKID
jgi:tRNA pseudouridine(38-40) synthase